MMAKAYIVYLLNALTVKHNTAMTKRTFTFSDILYGLPCKTVLFEEPIENKWTSQGRLSQCLKCGSKSNPLPINFLALSLTSKFNQKLSGLNKCKIISKAKGMHDNLGH